MNNDLKFINDLSYLNYKIQNAKESKLFESALNLENNSTSTVKQISLTKITTEATTISSIIRTTRVLPEITTENSTEKVFTEFEISNDISFNNSMLATEQTTYFSQLFNESTDLTTEIDHAITKELLITESYENYKFTNDETITSASFIQTNTSLDYNESFSNQTNSTESFSFSNATEFNLELNTSTDYSHMTMSFNRNDSFDYEQFLAKNSSQFTKSTFTSENYHSKSLDQEEEHLNFRFQTTNNHDNMDSRLVTKVETFPGNSTIDINKDDYMQTSVSSEIFQTTKDFKASTENSFSSLISLNTELQILGMVFFNFINITLNFCDTIMMWFIFMDILAFIVKTVKFKHFFEF